MIRNSQGAYGADDDIVDFILGITFEIWEQGGVDLVHRYYAPDCVVYGLDGVIRGAAAVVDGTRETLRGFPDRLLLAENVIWNGSRDDGYYTSHRLLSLATNSGPTVYGPATGVRIRMTNIADCIVRDGAVVEEWLVRDNMTLATQLGAEPVAAARAMAQRHTPALKAWVSEEIARLARVQEPGPTRAAATPRANPEAFAWRVFSSIWRGDKARFDTTHAPYSVLHRSPLRHYSGRDAVFDYYQGLRKVLGGVRFSVDHVASQPFAESGTDIAVRWTVSGTHDNALLGVPATGKPLFILGVTHWRCIGDRIASETTVFDDLAVLSQAFAE
ncbi:MAG: ester cyclase [Pseudomonadota bacterium]